MRPYETVAGRKPKLNFTPILDQYTTTDGAFHRLGKDELAAEAQFKCLIRQAEKGVAADPRRGLGDLPDLSHDFADGNLGESRYRHGKQRSQEFKDHAGDGTRAKYVRVIQAHDGGRACRQTQGDN